MIIKEYLSNYFNLPPEFVTGEANLYTLAILSLFFEEQAADFGIIPADVDLVTLNIDARQKENLENKEGFLRISLDSFLKPEKVDPGRPVCFDDPVGADGFMEFQFHAWLCVIETSRQVTNGLAYDEEVGECLTVQELNDKIEVVLA